MKHYNTLTKHATTLVLDCTTQFIKCVAIDTCVNTISENEVFQTQFREEMTVKFVKIAGKVRKL
jgi:sugar (pentulose or hexulose) kinase